MSLEINCLKLDDQLSVNKFFMGNEDFEDKRSTLNFLLERNTILPNSECYSSSNLIPERQKEVEWLISKKIFPDPTCNFLESGMMEDPNVNPDFLIKFLRLLLSTGFIPTEIPYGLLEYGDINLISKFETQYSLKIDKWSLACLYIGMEISNPVVQYFLDKKEHLRFQDFHSYLNMELEWNICENNFKSDKLLIYRSLIDQEILSPIMLFLNSISCISVIEWLIRQPETQTLKFDYFLLNKVWKDLVEKSDYHNIAIFIGNPKNDFKILTLLAERQYPIDFLEVKKLISNILKFKVRDFKWLKYFNKFSSSYLSSKNYELDHLTEVMKFRNYLTYLINFQFTTEKPKPEYPSSISRKVCVEESEEDLIGKDQIMKLTGMDSLTLGDQS